MREGRSQTGPYRKTIRALKSYSSKRMHELNLLLDQPVWHRGMHDRIIRDHAELIAKRNYIRANPTRWADTHVAAPYMMK
jgi:hypothetical protein